MTKQVGQKIYYDKVTGNIIEKIGEMQGGVMETTIDQDFECFERLKGRVKETVGLIQLQYGELRTEFARSSGQRVDITKPVIDSLAIVFDYTPQVEEEIIQEKTLTEKVTTLEKENITLKEEIKTTNQAVAELTMMIATPTV